MITARAVGKRAHVEPWREVAYIYNTTNLMPPIVWPCARTPLCSSSGILAWEKVGLSQRWTTTCNITNQKLSGQRVKGGGGWLPAMSTANVGYGWTGANIFHHVNMREDASRVLFRGCSGVYALWERADATCTLLQLLTPTLHGTSSSSSSSLILFVLIPSTHCPNRALIIFNNWVIVEVSCLL